MSGKDAARLGSRPSDWKARLRWISLAVAIVAFCWWLRNYGGPRQATAKAPAEKTAAKSAKGSAAAADDPAPPGPVAVVNGERIGREELAKECLRHYGQEVLENLVNKQLIVEACRKRNIAVSNREVDEEIERMAHRFSLPRDQYLRMLEKERQIKSSQYAKDIVWPTLALRKLAASKLTVSDAELKTAYESEFGAAVKVRLIATNDPAKAEQIRKKALAEPDEFPSLAKKFSKDVNSAAVGGLIQPIRRHLGDAGLEKAAFALKEGEISPVVQVGNQHVILKCEGRIEAAEVDRTYFDTVLKDAIADRKLRTSASDLMKSLQAEAKVENIFNEPARGAKYPGIAATVNGRPIGLAELGEECIERHGVEVLEGAINHRLLEQALRKRNLKVGEEDLHDEVARAAKSMGFEKDGQADVEKWIEATMKQQGVSREVYFRDAVWPSVALKKLVGDKVEVTEADLKKGFEANYGPRVRCLAIVLNSQRKAQEVWEKARDNPTVKNFGELAEAYSIEAGSRALKGEVPPIQKHGGQPLLEKEAFALQEGELSGIIQTAGDNFVILFCEGFTKPVKVEFAEVRETIREQIEEKKLRIAMAEEFEKVQKNSHIDNYLAGTVKAAERPASAIEPADELPVVRTPAKTAGKPGVKRK